jgi:hypothetical protein
MSARKGCVRCAAHHDIRATNNRRRCSCCSETGKRDKGTPLQRMECVGPEVTIYWARESGLKVKSLAPAFGGGEIFFTHRYTCCRSLIALISTAPGWGKSLTMGNLPITLSHRDQIFRAASCSVTRAEPSRGGFTGFRAVSCAPVVRWNGRKGGASSEVAMPADKCAEAPPVRYLTDDM